MLFHHGTCVDVLEAFSSEASSYASLDSSTSNSLAATQFPFSSARTIARSFMYLPPAGYQRVFIGRRVTPVPRLAQ